MNFTTLNGDLRFWDEFAPWYERWLNRGEYHRIIVNEITQMIEPGWKVLDIGAGTGVISIPMASLGCMVKALEPSTGMRKIFEDKLTSLKVKNIEMYCEKWEDMNPQRATFFDLIIACNSLHLTRGGLMEGMAKVFTCMPGFVCLVTEINQGKFIDFKKIDSLQKEYNFLYIKTYRVDSSFFFRNMDEVKELTNILDREMHVSIEGERPIQRDSSDIAILWWERK